MSASVLCPKCKSPLNIPKPAPEKIFCASCGASFRNASYKAPGHGSTESLNGQTSASGHGSQIVAGQPPREPVPIGAAETAVAGAGTAVAEYTVAKLLADPAPTPVGRKPTSAPTSKKAAMLMGAGGAAAAVLCGLLLYAMLKTDPSKKTKDDQGGISLEDDGARPSIGSQPELPASPKPVDPKVKDSIKKGVEYLRKQIPGGGGGRPGAFSLLGLTLLECDVPASDADVQKVAEMVRSAAPRLDNPYDIAPAIFFLDRMYKDGTPTDVDRKLIQSLGLRLVAGQHRPVFLWRYHVNVLKPEEETKLLKDIDEGTFQGGPLSNDNDMSCSQFAALGLWTARRHFPKEMGLPCDDALRKAGLSAHTLQTGGTTWNYHSTGQADGNFRDTSTCCGLILLSLGDAAAEKKAAEPMLKRIPVKNALKHLEGVISANKNPLQLKVDGLGGLYFLWALERTALILDLDKIGEEDWHKWGTEIVLAHQRGEGHWDAGHGGVPDTCFALLFMRRANLFQDLTIKLSGLAGPQSSIMPLPSPADSKRG